MVLPRHLENGKSYPNSQKRFEERHLQLSDYRPTSILPIASKILEKHVAIHFYEYMTSYNLLHQKQSGFRANHSCETALTLMVYTWLSALNKGNQIGLLLIDLCRAFDLVDHDLLIKNMKFTNVIMPHYNGLNFTLIIGNSWWK